MATGRIELDAEDRKLLEGWSRAQRVEHRLKLRSQIILKAAEGCTGREIGKSLSIPDGQQVAPAVFASRNRWIGGRAA
jgi:hypothetical protein